MLPAKIEVRNYRSFVGAHVLELRPLTLVFGRNNAGKSALVRTLPLLADSVAASVLGPLALDSAATRGGGFEELSTQLEISSDEDQALGLGFEWRDSSLEAARFSFVRNIQGVFMRDVQLLAAGERWELQRIPSRGGGSSNAFMCRSPQMQGEQVEVSFEGLTPVEFSPSLAPVLEPLRERLLTLRGGVSWLSANRGVVARRFRKPPARWERMAPDGADAPQVLASDPQVRARVSAWLSRVIARELSLVDEPPEEFRCKLHNARHSQPQAFDLIDSGNGPGQALPVLTAAAMLERDYGARVLVLEEPGANLDALAQRELARELCAVAKGPRQPRLVLETHAQALLLGVQLAVADPEQAIGPEDVVIHWVEQDDHGRSRVDRFTLDGAGRFVGAWPDPFRPVRELTRELLATEQRRRRALG